MRKRVKFAAICFLFLFTASEKSRVDMNSIEVLCDFCIFHLVTQNLKENSLQPTFSLHSGNTHCTCPANRKYSLHLPCKQEILTAHAQEQEIQEVPVAHAL